MSDAQTVSRSDNSRNRPAHARRRAGRDPQRVALGRSREDVIAEFRRQALRIYAELLTR